jgi:hypothetical protein
MTPIVAWPLAGVADRTASPAARPTAAEMEAMREGFMILSF